MSELPQIDWRPFFSGPKGAADIKYIRDSWLAAYKKSPWAGCIPNNLYPEVMTAAIDQLIARGSRILTIRNPANPELIIAWCCYELTARKELVIHAIYTKQVYRRQGAAKSLLRELAAASGNSNFFYTFKTAASRYLRGTFRPEIARRRDNKGRPHDNELH